MTWHKDFIKNGYVVFPNLVSSHLIAKAHEAIVADLHDNFDPARQQEYDSISHCPDLCSSPVIMDLLLKSPVWNLLDETLGVDKIIHGGGQIVVHRAHNSQEERTLDGFHLDGIPNGLNGLTGQHIDNFTALIGISLTDASRPYVGNLGVWPGSHYVIEKYFRDVGPRAMNMGLPKVELGQPVQLSMSAGDVALCHYQLAHGAVTNTSDKDRIAVYFRVALADIAQRRWELLTNIWNGWKIASLSL